MDNVSQGQEITPAQALQNLARASEQVLCNGADRDALRASVQVLARLVYSSPEKPAEPKPTA